METDAYFQFPLCLLGAFDDTHRRAESIISFSFIRAGYAIASQQSPAELKAFIKRVRESSDTPKDFHASEPMHVAAMAGAIRIGVRSSNIRGSCDNYEAAMEFATAMEAKYGRDVEVRVPKNLLFEVRDKAGMTWREFSILCAVLYCVGAAQYPVRITRETIQRRALGYKSKAAMDAEFPNRKDGAVALTLRQINYSLDALEERKWFARARPNARQTYYSNRLTADELEARLFSNKTYAPGFHQKRVERNASLMHRIKAAQTAIKADSPIIVDKTEKSRSNNVHSASTECSHSVHESVHYNKNSLIKTPLIKTPSKETPLHNAPAAGESDLEASNSTPAEETPTNPAKRPEADDDSCEGCLPGTPEYAAWVKKVFGD
jgi:hypothetical protein